MSDDSFPLLYNHSSGKISRPELNDHVAQKNEEEDNIDDQHIVALLVLIPEGLAEGEEDANF